MYPQDPRFGQHPGNGFGPGGRPTGNSYPPPASTFQQPVVQQPALQQPTYQQPTYQQSAYQQSAYQADAWQRPNPHNGFGSAYPNAPQPNLAQLPKGNGGKAIALVVGAATLVAAMVVTLIIVLKPSGASAAPTPGQPGPSGPQQPVAQTTSSPTSGTTGVRPFDPLPGPNSTPANPNPVTTDQPTNPPTNPPTTRPRTTTPKTTQPSTPTPRTTAPSTDNAAAKAAATSWVNGVNGQDAEQVLEVSCSTDLDKYNSGDYRNPAQVWGGVNTFTVQSVTAAGKLGVARLSVSPAINGNSSLTVPLVVQEGAWKMCVFYQQ